jgi:hypothetical protein
MLTFVARALTLASAHQGVAVGFATDELINPPLSPPPTSWRPGSCLTPGHWTAVVASGNDLVEVPNGLTITGDPWPLHEDEHWLETASMDLSEFSVSFLVPSLSPTGAALLAGLVFGLGIAGLVVQQRRRAG